MVRVTIVGTGDRAHALSHLFQNNNCQWSGNFLEVTRPCLLKGGVFHATGVPLEGFEAAVSHADIVVLALPGKALKPFLSSHLGMLKDKVVVDAAGSPPRGQDINCLLSVTNVRWVKAFNDIDALDLLLSKPSYKMKIPSKMCSRYPEALEIVKSFAESSLGLDAKIVPFDHYVDISNHQESFGDEWVTAMWAMFTLLLCTEVYTVLRHNVYQGYSWHHMPLYIANKAMCWSSITGFTFTQLPGIMVQVWKTIIDEALENMPRWLQTTIAMRKHIGILSLWFMVVHIMMSLILFSPAYFRELFAISDGTPSTMNAIGEASLFFGVMGASFYMVVGVCSFPTIGMNMTSKQASFLYGVMTWLALASSTVHILVMGVKEWNDQNEWPGGMPPITLTSTMFPLFVMGLKLIQVGHSYIGNFFRLGLYDDCRSEEMTITFDTEDMGRLNCFDVPDYITDPDMQTHGIFEQDLIESQVVYADSEGTEADGFDGCVRRATGLSAKRTYV